MQRVVLSAKGIVVLTFCGFATMVSAGELDSPNQQLNAAAPVQGTGLYLGGGIAGVFDPNESFSMPNIDPGFPASSAKKDSFGGLAELKAGYDWSVKALDPAFTLGVEGDFDGGAQYLSSHAVSGDVFVNGFGVKTGLAEGVGIIAVKAGYNLGIFRPYVGVGGGGAVVATIDPKFNTVTGTFKASEATTYRPAYRGFAGVDVFLSRNWALNAEYRYEVISDVNFSSGKTSELDFGDLKQQQVECGVKYYFY